MVVNALCYGDSIADPWGGYGNGVWFDQACQYFGWTRVGIGTGTTDYTRSAILGTPLQLIRSDDTYIQKQIPTVSNGAYASAQFTARLNAYAPRVVFVELGTNDYVFCDNTYQTPTTFASNLDTLLTQIDAMPSLLVKALVGMSNLPANGQGMWLPGGAAPSWATSLQDAWNQMTQILIGKAAAHGFTYVDMSAIPGAYLPDNIHPGTPTVPSPLGQNYYFQRVIQSVGPGVLGYTPDPVWHCTRKY